MLAFCNFLLGLMALVSISAHALSVEYRFTGELTGDIHSLFASPTFVDTQFTLSIFADTDNVSPTAYIAGAGRGFSNYSGTAIWSVVGLGKATSSDVQIYSLPGLARIGFAWNGQVVPLNSGNLAQTLLYFNANAIATDSNYGRLSTIVTPIAIELHSSLKNPQNMIPEYTTMVYFDAVGPLTLKNLSNVRYSVIAVPEPSNLALLMTGLGVVAVLIRHRRFVLD